jgi:glycosyltransferase involved in cell wall biosynthesis
MKRGVSIIVPVRDRPDELAALVQSLQQSIHEEATLPSTLSIEVLIVNDRSKARPVTPKGDDWTVLDAEGHGPGSARNTGAKYASHELLLFTDSDCIVSPSWIRSAVSSLEHSNRLLQGNPTLYQRSNEWGVLEEQLYSHMFSRYILPDRRGVLMLDSRNMGIHRSLLIAHGGFDAEAPEAHAESRLLAHRLVRSIGPAKYDEDVRVYHKSPPTIHHEMRTKFRHGAGRAQLWATRKPTVRQLLTRYFIEPIDAGCSEYYTLRVHLAFLLGYFTSVTEPEPTDLLEEVLDFVKGRDSGALVCLKFAFHGTRNHARFLDKLEEEAPTANTCHCLSAQRSLSAGPSDNSQSTPSYVAP